MVILERLNDNKILTGNALYYIEIIMMPNETPIPVKTNKPVIGHALVLINLVGEEIWTKYWLTSQVTQITEDKDDFLLFSTQNSNYKLYKDAN